MHFFTLVSLREVFNHLFSEYTERISHGGPGKLLKRRVLQQRQPQPKGAAKHVPSHTVSQPPSSCWFHQFTHPFPTPCFCRKRGFSPMRSGTCRCGRRTRRALFHVEEEVEEVEGTSLLRSHRHRPLAPSVTGLPRQWHRFPPVGRCNLLIAPPPALPKVQRWMRAMETMM